MSVLFNQTNIAPGTAFATGGGGGSNLSNLTVSNQIIVGASNQLVIRDDSMSFLPYVVPPAPQPIKPLYFYNGTQTLLIADTLQGGVAGSGGIAIGPSTITSAINEPALSNVSWNAAEWSYNPAQGAQGGDVFLRLTFNPDDGGQTAIRLGANGTEGAYLYSLWEGFVYTPLTLRAQNFNVLSGAGQTNLFIDGDASLISTGQNTVFSSRLNTLSTITDPTGAYTADTTALFSTFKTLYPSNFL
jgi:hypothetical protein